MADTEKAKQVICSGSFRLQTLLRRQTETIRFMLNEYSSWRLDREMQNPKSKTCNTLLIKIPFAKVRRQQALQQHQELQAKRSEATGKLEGFETLQRSCSHCRPVVLAPMILAWPFIQQMIDLAFAAPTLSPRPSAHLFTATVRNSHRGFLQYQEKPDSMKANARRKSFFTAISGPLI